MADIDNEKVNDVEIGIIGSGSMGAGMTLLFSEKGSIVGCYDYEAKAVEKVMQQAKEDPVVDESKVHGFTKLELMVKAFPQDGKKPKIVLLSLPHGKPVDGIQKEILPLLSKGDIVIDAGNEWWADTEKRQKIASEKGVRWVGMGVSGGYQAARHGPSMSVGCDEETWDIVKPYLEKWTAHTPQGEACVLRMGPGGSGHYVKMIHNGIEHAHLSILCEIRGLLYHQLNMSNDEIADLFEAWWKDDSSMLRGNFLVGIGYKGLRFKEGDHIKNEKGVVEDIEDKVTQDVDLSEGTGTWSTREVADRHVAAPAIAASHILRIISSDKQTRGKVADNLQIPQPHEAQKVVKQMGEQEKKDFLEVVHQAVYGCILAGFVQGLEIITKASTTQKWDVSLHDCLLIWRAGCIIQSDAIAEFLLPLLKPFGPSKPLNLKSEIPELAKELGKSYAAIKRVYSVCIETDAVAPAVGSTLEWLKSVGGRNLPTDFEEMELDYFGHHNYDIKGHAKEGHEKGKYHTEFQST